MRASPPTVEDTFGHNEQPGSGRLAARDVVESAPRNRKYLIGGVISVGDRATTEAIRKHVPEVPLIELVESTLGK